MRTYLTRSEPRRARLAAALLATLGVGGCGGGGNAGTAAGTGAAGSTTSATTGSTSHASTTGSSTSTSGGTGGGSGVITCSGQPAALSLSGTWAAYAQLSVKLQGAAGGAITICPADQIGAATLLLMVTVEQDATDPTKLDQVKATLCSVALPTTTALVGTCDPTSPALVSTQLIVPQKLIDALPTVAAATAAGQLGGTAPGATIMIDPLDVSVGTTQSGSNLPSWNTASSSCNQPNIGESSTCDTTCVSDCTAMRDDDMDQNPGVTIQVCGETADDKQSGATCNAAAPQNAGVSLQGEGYIDLEVNPSVTGTVKSSCEVSGTVATEVLYNLVGADVYLAGNPVTVSQAIESLPTFQVDPTASKFVMVRIDGQYGAPDWMVDPAQPSAACKIVNMRMNQL